MCDVSLGATGLAGVEKKGGSGLGLARMGGQKSEVSRVPFPPSNPVTWKGAQFTPGCQEVCDRTHLFNTFA